MRRASPPTFVVFILAPALTLALLGAARAQGPATPTACPGGNLLASRPPVAWHQIRGQLARATDGEKAPEGALWNAPLAVILDSDRSSLTWDLGAPVALAAVWIQADANDRYTVSGSLDGRDFRTLGSIDMVQGHGLRARTVAPGGVTVRYLRFGDGVGDGYYSLAEIAAYCTLPTPFPPAMRVGQAQPQPAGRNVFTYWNNESSARWQLVLALLGLALLQWGHKLRKQGTPEAHQPLRERLLAALGLLAALSFINFGFFHFGNFIHDHEWTHYYLGSKYFPELSYQRLYECITTADVEAGLRQRVAHRTITNLRTNVLEKTDDVLAHPERCKDHFTPARWAAFSRDVAFFRGRMSPGGWDDLQFDHGYNATPLWNATGSLLTNLLPASTLQLWLLAMLDPLYLLGTAALIGWAFGWRVLAVSLLVFATNFPSRFYWIGGAFLRYDWLFYLVAAIACLRKSRPATAGAALACAAGLRVFPVFLFVGPALALGWQLRRRTIDPSLRRFFTAAALAGALLFGVSLTGSGGLPAYRAFAENTAKHQATGLVNNMGLRTVLAWRPSEVGRYLKDDAIDPWLRWKEARLRAWQETRPAWLVLVVGVTVLLALAARHAQPWVLTALGVVLIPWGVELLSYYFAFIIALVPLVEKREEVGRWLLGLTAFTQFVAWAPLRDMSNWLDEQYTLMSLATLLVFALVLNRFRRAEPA
jgi:hypothetical protein